MAQKRGTKTATKKEAAAEQEVKQILGETAAEPANKKKEEKTKARIVRKTRESKAEKTKEAAPEEMKEEKAEAVKAAARKAEAVKPAEEKPKTRTTRKRTVKAKAEDPAAKAKAEDPAAEAKAEEPAAKAKAEDPAAEAKAEDPAAKAKAEDPAAEAKAEDPAAEARAEEPAAKAKTEEPAAKAKAQEAAAVEAETVEPETADASKADKTGKEEKPKAARKRASKTKAGEPAKPEEAAAVEAQPENGSPSQTEEPVLEKAEEPHYEIYTTPRRSVAFIGSECYPFVKTGGLADVMYALPKALVKQNCDVKVILPRYKCIPWEYQEKMIYRGSFQMDLCADGRSYYVGIMEYVWDGVVYDFIDNEEFFSAGNPYTNLIDDIPKYCYFAKAALAALNYMNWIPNVIHCHDWQAALVPVYLRTLFEQSNLTTAKTILTIHNLRFQGVYNIPTIRYWSGLPDYVFNKDALKEGYEDANMLKGGLTYSNMITTVSNTYAWEIQTPYYGEGLDAHLRYHSGKLRGIVNGIDYDIWNTASDSRLYMNYDITNVLEQKRENKRRLQEELGLVQDDQKFVIGLISRLTNQKGLDLVNAILPQVIDGNTQVVVLGTGDSVYEDSFRYYENTYKGSVCSNIMYDETRAHKIYAGADALLVPSQFEPCGLTQLIAMHYGTIPIVRETGGLKDTVEPYNMYYNTGNGFTFDKYDAGLLLDAINRAKTLYFTNRWCWDEMVQRDMAKNFSWDNSARQYKDLYLELVP